MPAVAVALSGDIFVGGDDGFSASLAGTIDTDVGSATLAFSHPGGWSPLSGELASNFATPQFSGELAIGVGGTSLNLSAHVAFSPIELQDGVLYIFGGTPESGEHGRTPIGANAHRPD